MCKKIELGSVITYLGGAGVLLSSSQTQPIPKDTVVERIQLMQASVPVIEVTLADITTLGGFGMLILRFIWDIYRDRRSKPTWTVDPQDQRPKPRGHTPIHRYQEPKHLYQEPKHLYQEPKHRHQEPKPR